MKAALPCSQPIRVAHAWPAVIAAAVCTLALQACGGGGSDNNAQPSPNPGGTPTLPQATQAPSIGYGPRSQTVTVRQPVFFNVSLTDQTPALYQWQRNGVDIPGATQFNYQFVVQAADAGARITVVLRNSAGSVTSEPAVVTVLDAPTGELSRFAGSIGGDGNLDGTGAAGRFDGPFGLAIDAAGDVLVAGGGLRRVGADGTVSPLTPTSYRDAAALAVDGSGNVYVATNGRFAALSRIGPDGTSRQIAWLTPSGGRLGLALDPGGNAVVAYCEDVRIERIDPVSGQPTVLVSRDGANPTQTFRGACSVAIDATGRVVFTDANANTVRRIEADGSITTLVPAVAGLLLRPGGLAFDPATGSLLIADTGNRQIRRLLPNGDLAIVAGVAGSAGMQDGPATSARFTEPTSLALAPNGDLYIADNHTVRRLDTRGNVTTIAGLAAPSDPAFGRYHATDAAGNVYVAQPTLFTPGAPYVLLKITLAGDTTMLAIGLSDPQGIALDDAGNVYVADVRADCSGGTSTNCNRYGLLLKGDAALGQFRVLAGSSRPASGPDDYDVDGVGAAARFGQTLNDVAVDAAGNVYVGQSGMIRKVSPNGTVSTLTTATGAQGLAVDRTTGDVLASSCKSVAVSVLVPRLSRIDPAGNVTPLPPGDYRPDRQDYLADRTLNNCPEGMAVDAAGNVFIAYSTLNVVRKLSPDGASTTVVGRPDLRGILPGLLPASLLSPSDLSFDGAGNLTIGSPQAILKVRFSK